LALGAIELGNNFFFIFTKLLCHFSKACLQVAVPVLLGQGARVWAQYSAR
jgi:hypothetical protein